MTARASGTCTHDSFREPTVDGDFRRVQSSWLYAATGPVTLTRTSVPGMGTEVPETRAVTSRPEARTSRCRAASCP